MGEHQAAKVAVLRDENPTLDQPFLGDDTIRRARLNFGDGDDIMSCRSQRPSDTEVHALICEETHYSSAWEVDLTRNASCATTSAA